MCKKSVMSFILGLSLIFPSVVFASNSNDPCTVLVCMAGKAAGQGGGSDCNKAIKTFFNITKKKKGKFNAGRTFDARKAFLNQCSPTDPASVSKVMSKYGRARG